MDLAKVVSTQKKYIAKEGEWQLGDEKSNTETRQTQVIISSLTCVPIFSEHIV